MNKQTVTIKINIPAEFLMGEMTKEYVKVEATVHSKPDHWFVIIDEMTFSRCVAFAIRTECIAKFLDHVEQLCIEAAYNADRDFEEDQMYYHELAGYGF